MTLTIKARVFKELDKNPLLLPYQLCAILQIPYKKHGRTVSNYKRLHKLSLKNRQALKCLKFHNTRGWIYAPKKLNSRKAVKCGWKQTKAKNRMLLFVAKEGRLEWFVTTGRINIWVRKPAHWGKVKQLLARGFYHDLLIDDINLFTAWAETARFKGSHLLYDTSMRLPYACVELLKDGNGVVVKMGDSSHPTALEIEFCYPDYAEKNEAATERNRQELKKLKDILADMLPKLTETLKLTTKQTEQFTKFMKELTSPKTTGDNPFTA